jgi:hypothetical protein
MLVFRYEVHRYVDDRYVRDLKQDARHVDDQMMDVQMFYVLGDQLLGAHRDHYVVKMNEYLMNVVLKYVAYRLLALMNENVRILELQRFHQLAFQRVA